MLQLLGWPRVIYQATRSLRGASLYYITRGTNYAEIMPKRRRKVAVLSPDYGYYNDGHALAIISCSNCFCKV